jgi:hypothetical protein
MTLSALVLTASATLITLPAHAELTTAQIKNCASYVNGHTEDLLKISQKDLGARYIIEGSDVYKMTLPLDGSFIKLDPKVFPTTRGLCYSTDRLYSRESSELTESQLKHCQTTPAVGFEKLSGTRLNEAFEAVMDRFRSTIEDQFMYSAGPDGKIDADTAMGQSGELKALSRGLDDCGRMTPLSSYALAKYQLAKKEMEKAFTAYGIKNNGPIKWHVPVDQTPKNVR